MMQGWQMDLVWIPRTQNEECDALSRGALEEAGVLPEIQPPSSPSGLSKILPIAEIPLVANAHPL